MSRFLFRRSCIAALACVASLTFAVSNADAQGLFAPPSAVLATGTTPKGVAAADFTRSGYQSLVVTDSAGQNIAGQNIKVYLATGAGTFAPAYSYPACNGHGGTAGPVAVVAADINNDGYPDILVACPTQNTVDVFENDGSSAPGTFSETATLNVTDPVALVAGNFTGNNTMDLAVATGTGGVTVFLNLGGATSTKTIAQSGTLTGIVAGDFNHDGITDLAVSDSANNNVHVLTGDGTGNFTLLGSYSTGAGTRPNGIVAADFNKDGNLDVATTNAGTNTATVLLGSASGALTVQSAQSTGTGPIGIAVADVNSDGYPDVIAFDSPTAFTGAVAVLLGNGDGTLQTAQITSQTFVPGTLAAVADFNRDGKPDLAVAQQNANQVSLLLNNTLPTAYPDGRSYSPYRALVNGYGNMADGIATGDFNKDGLLDLAVSYLSDNAVRVLLNNGNGFNTAAEYAVGAQPYWIASGDLNGDGYPDLVTANTNVNSANGTVSVLLNNGKTGNGTFAPAVNYTVGWLPYQVAIGDINGDGYPDLAVTNYGSNTVSILMGSKNGTFTVSPTTLATCTNPYGVVIGDFAHNGFPSIAVTCYATAQLEVFPNNGNGTFGSPSIYTTDAHPTSLVTGDFNRDGKLDIVVGNSTANDIYFFAGNGNNTFNAGVESPSLNFPDSIAAGDVNGDGILDIVGVAPNYNTVLVSLGVGDGTFGTFQQRAGGGFAAVKQPWAVALGDFNNDGQLDIATANTYNQVNLTIPAYQQRYMAEYPATPTGNPSIDVLTNDSAANVSLSVAPPNNVLPLPANNSNVVIQASVQPALSGSTPTGSVIFENSSGAPLGTGPYTLSAGGVASYNVGHLGSGNYQFTALYSGDSNYQPTTASGANFAVSVAGTPVALTISPASVVYGSTFTANVTVTGTAREGYPTGTLTIYSSTGFKLGTVTLTNSGTNDNTVGTATFTATAPNLNVGSYEFYAVYQPTNGNYQQGTSSYAPLTVTAAPTATAISCSYAFLSIDCTATITNAATGTAVPAGLTVDFSVNGGGAIPIATNGAGQANYTTGVIIGYFTIATTFPVQGNYLGSTNSTSVLCFFVCGLDRPEPSVPFTAFSALGYSDKSSAPAILRAEELNRGRPRPLPLF